MEGYASGSRIGSDGTVDGRAAKRARREGPGPMRNSVCQSEARGEMTKTPIALQELRRRIYRKAKSEKAHRCWGIFVHVTRTETLEVSVRVTWTKMPQKRCA